MKFENTTYTKIKKGDYIRFVSNRMPDSFIYGYVRLVDGEKIVQSKNIIQRFNTGFAHIKPESRFFKIKLKSRGKISVLK